MDQRSIEHVLDSPRLPSLPAIAVKVTQIVEQPNVTIKEIAETIQHDPALASKILKIVNSSFYGQSKAITTISHALVILGLNTVKTLALGFSLVKNMHDMADDVADPANFWKRSLYTSVAARSFAHIVTPQQQDEAFLGGLFHDLGVLVMGQALGQQYRAATLSVQGQHKPLSQVERDVFGFDHAEVGSTLLERWKLPDVLVSVLRHYEQPDQGPEKWRPVIRCVALGSRVADVFLDEDGATAINNYHDAAKQWANISADEADMLIQNVDTDAAEVRKLFALPTGELENIDTILARASEAMQDLSLEQQQQEKQLRRKYRKVVPEAPTDGLTGAANRRQFDQYVHAQFKLTDNNGPPVSVIFIDIDPDKNSGDDDVTSINGHALMALAKLLHDTLPDNAMIARYEAGEFAIVLPDTDRDAAADFSEQIRLQIQVINADSNTAPPLSITTTIGVACHTGTLFSNVDELVNAADHALYTAKAAGRNHVGIYSNRPGVSPSKVDIA